MDARAARPRARLRDRAPADQSRLVSRRHRALRAESRTYGITTLTQAPRDRAREAGSRFHFRGKHSVQVRTTIVDAELADAIEGAARAAGRPRDSSATSGTASSATSPAQRLNDYIRGAHGRGVHGARTSARGAGRCSRRSRSPSTAPPETETEAKRVVAAVMRPVGEQLGNTPAVARRRTSAPRCRAVSRRHERSRISGHAICASSVRAISASIRRSRRCSAAAFVANSARARSRVDSSVAFSVRLARTQPLEGGISVARKTVLVCDNCGKEVDEGKGATMRIPSPTRAAARSRPISATTAPAKMPGRPVARRGRRPKSATA